jgi:hypothetical protein
MTLATDILGGCSCRQAMSGGRGAARFSSELRQASQCHQPLARGSSWIQGIFHAVPGLSSGFEYDGLLGPLLQAILHPQSQSSVRTGPRRSPTRPVSASPRAALRALELSEGGRTSAGWSRVGVTSGRTRRETSSPSFHSEGSGQRHLAQAELARLARLTPETGSAAVKVRRNGSPASSTTYAYPWPDTAVIAPSVRGSTNFSPTPSADTAAMEWFTPSAIRNWQSRMVERVRLRLRSSAGGYGSVTAASHAMQELWSQALDGPAASPEVLLAEIEPQGTAACAADASPTAAGFIPLPASAPASGSGPATEFGGPVGQPAVLANAVASPEGAAVAALQVLSEDLLSKAHDEPWLPSLIPSRRRGGETPRTSSPASLTKTEIAPPHQDLDLGEDLTALSLKMKRVLNEEARRHGIGV